MIASELRPRQRSVLIVAGEASGDRIAALVARELLARGVRCWGVAGRACLRAGVEVLADLSGAGVMGVSDALRRAPAIATALSRLALRVAKEPPAAAMLVNFTELNTYLGRLLRRLGVHVLWCVAPQAWAWRRRRFQTLGSALDRLAVILPFEEELWRRAGVDAYYVGHPALDTPFQPRAMARSRLGLRGAAGSIALAVLPGSRAGEVSRLARPLCEAASLLLRDGSADEARVIAAPWLDSRSRSLVLREADRSGIPLVEPSPDDGAAPLLSAFDLSLCASGTASLEAALAGALPVVTYRMDPLSFGLARLLVKTPYVALPNILLGRRAVPELLQNEVTGARIAAEARALLQDRGAAASLAVALRERLRSDGSARSGPRPYPSLPSFGARVADLLAV